MLNGEAKPVRTRRQHRRQGRRDAGRRRDQRPGRQAQETKDQYVELAARRPTGSSWSSPSSATSGTRATRTRTPTRHPGPGRRSTARCTTRSPSRTAAVDNSTVWQPDYNQEHFQELYFGTGAGVESLKTVLREAVLGPLQRRRHGHRLGEGAVQRGPLRPLSNGFPCASNVCTQHLGPGPGRRQPVGRRPEGGRPHRRADRRPSSRRSTCGTATTSTATATSTSPTATSTTSRSCTPAATRPTATRSRARTRSGATAGTRSRATGAAGPAGNLLGGTQIGDTGLWVGDYTIQPENGGRRVFATSTATTSACRTTTTPRRRRQQQRAGGPSWRRAGSAAKDDGGIGDPRRRPRRLGQAAARLARLRDRRGRSDADAWSSARTSTTAPRPQALVVVLPKKEVITELGRAVRGQQVSGGAARVTTSTHTMTRQVDAPGRHRDADLPGQLGHRGLRSDPCDYAYVEVDDGTGWTADPRHDHQAGRGQRHRRRHRRRLGAGDVRPVGLRRARRSACGSATPPTAPPAERRELPRLLRRRDHGRPPAARRCSTTAPRPAPTAGRWRLHAVGATVTNAVRQLLHRRAPQYVSYDQYLKTGPYNFGFAQHPAGLGRALPVPGRAC